MIEFAFEEGLVLSDASFTHAVAVAAILHLHWSHARDAETWSGAVKRLNRCMTFVARSPSFLTRSARGQKLA